MKTKTLERQFAEELAQELNADGAVITKQDTRNIERAFDISYPEYTCKARGQRTIQVAAQMELYAAEAAASEWFSDCGWRKAPKAITVIVTRKGKSTRVRVRSTQVVVTEWEYTS